MHRTYAIKSSYHVSIIKKDISVFVIGYILVF